MSKKIVVLTQGFVVVGEHEFDAARNVHVLSGASVVRVWGTSKGLGQLALEGPQEATKLDPCGFVEAPTGSVVFTIDCEDKAWK